jgi:hypothetical protein
MTRKMAECTPSDANTDIGILYYIQKAKHGRYISFSLRCI